LIGTFSGSRGIVYSLGIPFSAKKMFSGGIDGQVVLWNLITGKKIAEYDHHDSMVKCIFPLDGINGAVTVGRDNKILLLDYEDGKILKVIAKMKQGISGASSLLGNKIGVASDNIIYVYEPDGKNVIRADLPKYKITCFADISSVSANTELHKNHRGEIVLVTNDNLILHCKMPSY
jgi:WD40 repeat protein